MRRLRLERLARCRSSCLTLIQSCGMLRMSKPCPIVTSRCNTLAQVCAVSLSNIPGRETNSGSETSRSLAFTARQHLANQLHTFRRDNRFSARLGVAAGFLAHLSPARDALSFLFAFGGNFASAVATINSQVELMEGFAAISRALSGGSYLPLIIYLSSAHPLCKRPSVPFPRKTVFSHPSRFQFWEEQENPSNLR